MKSKKSSLKWVVFCFAFFIVPSCVALNYTPINLDPTVKALLTQAFIENDQILQNCFNRVTDKFLELLTNIANMLRTELGTTQVDILNSRALEQTREYTNEVWLIIDQTEKYLDVECKYAQRRIERKVGNESPDMDDVEGVFTKTTDLMWAWQNESGRLIYDTNERGQQIIDGLAYEALNALQKCGRRCLEQVIVNRRNVLLELFYRVRQQIATQANKTDARIAELSQLLLDVGRKLDNE